MLPFKIEAAVVCDDLRVENTGKHILIGVYVGVIGLLSLPTQLTLTWWIETAPPSADKIDGQMKIVHSDGAVLAQGNFSIVVEPDKASIITLQKVPVQIQSFGEIALMFKIGSDDWVPIRKIKVVDGTKLTKI